MKNLKHYMLGALTMSAALAFTACSSENGEIKPQDDVKGFYLRLSLVGEQTRTEVENPTEAATTEESAVTGGTIYLYDKDGALAFQKRLTADDWAGTKPGQGATGTTNAIAVSVNNVKAGEEYSVYFLANDAEAGLDVEGKPLTYVFTSNAAFAGKLAQDGRFVMINQNDPSCKADQYKVTFKEENKNQATPATIVDNKSIKIERVVARIDAPKVEATTIAAPAEGSATTSQADAKTKVETLELLGYAISNLPHETNILQKWDFANSTLSMPNVSAYYNPYSSFGDATETGSVEFGNATKNYVLENKALSNGNNYTAMYMKFKVTLNSEAGVEKDFTDGTFYRYDNKIYTSLDAIKNSIGGTDPFGKTTAALLAILGRNEAGECTADEGAISGFRKDYHIEVFVKGACYYRTPVEATSPRFDTYYTVMRNTIYKINVKNIYNVGTDVPNGDPDDKKPNYYMQVTVSVNPWVLKTYNVDLQ